MFYKVPGPHGQSGENVVSHVTGVYGRDTGLVIYLVRTDHVVPA